MIAFWRHSAAHFEHFWDRPGPVDVLGRCLLGSYLRHRRLVGAALLGATVVGATLLMGCGGAHKVLRRRGEQVELGRSVPSRAYAWYARARHLQRAGEVEQARQAYLEVLSLDPRSGAAYAGLGETFCGTDLASAEEAFAQGLRRAAEKLPIYLARGRCELSWGHPKRALASARLGFRVAPDAPEASVLLVAALMAAGRPGDAARVQRAHELYQRQHALLEPSSPSEPAVDAALAQGDIRLAEGLSLELMSRSSLALRAYALGRTSYARELAALIAAAAPSDPTAATVMLLTSDEPAPDLQPDALLDPLALCLLAERVRMDIGLEASSTYLAAASPERQTSVPLDWRSASDGLLASCAERLTRSGLSVGPAISARP